jgi:DNA-binding NarL/FixJ family response regulator
MALTARAPLGKYPEIRLRFSLYVGHPTLPVEFLSATAFLVRGRPGTDLPKRVLIADDNESVRKVIRSLVDQQPGVEVCAVTRDGIETAETAIALRPDLLIVDLLMPGLNGIEVTSIIKNNLPTAKIVLFTMYDDAIRALAPVMGANALLTKSDGITALLRTVRTMLSDKVKNMEETLTRAVQKREIDLVHLKSLTRRLGVPLTRCTRDLKYLWANQHYADWLQRPVEKVLGRPILDVLGKDAFESLRHRFDQALNGQAVTYQTDANYERIGPRRICAVYQPTFQADGTPDGWLAFVDDVTNNLADQFDAADPDFGTHLGQLAQESA